MTFVTHATVSRTLATNCVVNSDGTDGQDCTVCTVCDLGFELSKNASSTPNSQPCVAQGTFVSLVSVNFRQVALTQVICIYNVNRLRYLAGPTITCPLNMMSVAPIANKAHATVSYTVPATAIDNSGFPTTKPVCSPAPGTFYITPSSQPHVVNCTASDVYGNVGFCTFRILVVDTVAPTVICPADIFTAPNDGYQNPVVNYACGFYDNQEVRWKSYSDNNASGKGPVYYTPGHRYPLGITLITCAAQDWAGLRSAPSVKWAFHRHKPHPFPLFYLALPASSESTTPTQPSLQSHARPTCRLQPVVARRIGTLDLGPALGISVVLLAQHAFPARVLVLELEPQRSPAQHAITLEIVSS